jgi:hypothetical protein
MFFFLYGLIVFIANICFYVYFWFKLDELKAVFRVNSFEIERIEYGVKAVEDKADDIAKQIKQMREGK